MSGSFSYLFLSILYYFGEFREKVREFWDMRYRVIRHILYIHQTQRLGANQLGTAKFNPDLEPWRHKTRNPRNILSIS